MRPERKDHADAAVPVIITRYHYSNVTTGKLVRGGRTDATSVLLGHGDSLDLNWSISTWSYPFDLYDRSPPRFLDLPDPVDV